MSVSLVKISPATVVYTVGANVPGYSPESDVAVFATIDDARSYLADELDQLADFLADVESDTAAEDGEDFELSNYALALVELVKSDRDGDITANVNAGGWTTYIETGRVLPTAYWIHATPLGDACEGMDAEEKADLIDALTDR